MYKPKPAKVVMKSLSLISTIYSQTIYVHKLIKAAKHYHHAPTFTLGSKN